MPGLQYLEDLGLGAPPDGDLLAVDGEQLPASSVEGGGPVFVQAFDVQVLGVSAHVRAPPGDAGVVPQGHARGEGQGHAPDVHAGTVQVDLEPDRRNLGEDVRVVGEERLPALGARTGHHPVVRALARREPRRLPQQLERRPAAHRAAVLPRLDHGRVGRDAREERGHGVPPEPVHDLVPEELAVPVRRQAPRHEHGGRADPLQPLPTLRERRVNLQQVVLDGAGGHPVDPAPDAGRERVRDVHGQLVPPVDQVPAGPAPSDRADEPVERERGLAEQLRESPASESRQEVDLEQALRGLDVPLGEVHVVHGARVDMRNAPPIPQDLDGLLQAREPDLSGRLGQARRCARPERVRELAHVEASLVVRVRVLTRRAAPTATARGRDAWCTPP